MKRPDWWEALEIQNPRRNEIKAIVIFDTRYGNTEKIGGNITMALAVLRAVALKAESEGKNSIDEVSLEEMLPQTDCLDELSNDERVIFRILSEWKNLPSNRLYAFYAQAAKYPKCERSFRNYMENLCSKGLVKAIGDKRGRVYELVEEGNDVARQT